MPRPKRAAKPQQAESYKHPDSSSPMRPDVGTQAQFKKRKPPQKYRYDDSLSPALEWDGQNSAREKGESHLSLVLGHLSEAQKALASVQSQLPEKDKKATTDNWQRAADSLRKAEEAAQSLKAMSSPFLNWAGKAERLSFDVPTLPLFVHERLSTKAIIETLTGHKRDKQLDMYSLFGDPQHSVTDQVLRAYEHRDKWVNRMMLGDSLAVMNSLLHYEGLGGQVQMIYMDPPYGVKFGSNFQPFVRKRDVSHNDDEDMTRESEMVQAYRDTWELGLHSYLTYLRDRLLICRDLLAPSGSIFVQISDENLHHVRELMDEVFGVENLCAIVSYRTTGAQTSEFLPQAFDHLLWYCRSRDLIRFRQLYIPDESGAWDPGQDIWIESSTGERRRLTRDEKDGRVSLPAGRVFRHRTIEPKSGSNATRFPIQLEGRAFHPKTGKGWSSGREGIDQLIQAKRLFVIGDSVRFLIYRDDFGFRSLGAFWDDTMISGFAEDKLYVVQTATKVVQRCILMTTDPGDLVLDPTCGSGTTAYVAEQWGRRWITMDTSRVPLALARQRLLTATFPWYELNDDARGPAGGFVYKRKQNNKGEEVGGIVPHVTLESIANNEPPKEEVLVDRPERDSKITRVTGAFCVEGTIPTPVSLLEEGQKGVEATIPTPAGAHSGLPIPDSREEQSTFTDRMLEILRKSPVLHLEGNRTVTLKNIRPPAKTLSLSAEALVDATASGQSPTLADAVQEAAEKNGKALPLSAKPVALVFGPENGAVSERLVLEAAREAYLKSYTHLYVIGFAIQPNARQLIENSDAVVGIPATYIQATPDLLMGDLLKNMRSSQIFSVCGLPEIKVHPVAAVSDRREDDGAQRSPLQYQVELLGLDVFDPVGMENYHKDGNDVPAWFLDTDYNGLCFHVSQAFFPRTSAWDNLKKALKGEYEESVWDHLSGTTSAPFEAGEQRQIAVKVIDDRGNELMVVEKLG